jgi:hypothetical protein
MSISTTDASIATDCLARARAAFLRGDLHAIIRLVGGSLNVEVERVWCLAMNAYFGPIGLAPSLRENGGVPTADVRASRVCGRSSETVGEFMERSHAELADSLGLHAVTVEYTRRLPADWNS